MSASTKAAPPVVHCCHAQRRYSLRSVRYRLTDAGGESILLALQLSSLGFWPVARGGVMLPLTVRRLCCRVAMMMALAVTF